MTQPLTTYFSDGDRKAEHQCVLCGAMTFRELVNTRIAGSGRHSHGIICEACVHRVEADESIELSIQRHRAEIERLESLRGRLRLPTYDELKAAEQKAIEAERATYRAYFNT